MNNSIRKAIVIMASNLAATGMASGVAGAEPKDPGPPKGAGCRLANGTVLRDGQMYTTSNGTTIWCASGQVCRMNKSNKTSCGVEAGWVPPLAPL